MLADSTVASHLVAPNSVMLGSLSLGLPVLAWGLLAIGAPIVIHLVFRERAQREVFPAMRFLIQSRASATRAHLLRHILLLTARIMLIVLAVAILGRLGCSTRGGSMPFSALSTAPPASVVFCIDNSASMGYRYQGQTRVQAAIDWAQSLIEDSRQFGPGSQFAVVSGTRSPGMEVWRDDIRATVKLVATVRPAAHNLSAAHLLSRATALLSSGRHPRREVFLFTDLTESSWDDSPPPLPETLTTLAIMDVGQDENRNVSLGWPQVPAHELPAGTPLTIPVRVWAGDLPCEPILEFSIDGKPRGRQTAGQLAPGSQSQVVLNIPPLEPGAHAMVVDLHPGDALDCDNRRYAWLFAGSLPKVGLVYDDRNSEVARMLEAMIAPPAAAPSAHHFTVVHVALDSLLTNVTEGCTALVLADVQSLNGLAWEKLATYLRGGGVVVVVPGPRLLPDGYKAGHFILPAGIHSVQACDPPLRPAASNLSHAYLLPFADLTIDALNDRHAFKRLSLGDLASEASVVVPFADGSPALLERRVGQGRAVMLAFSPAADWGQFGTQAAPTIVLLHQVLQTARPPLDSVAALTAGRAALRSLGDGSGPALVRSNDGSENTVRPAPGRLYPLPADSPQLYTALEKSSPQHASLYYSVNVAEAESRLGRLSGDSVKSRFDNGPIQVIRPGERVGTLAGSGPSRVNWLVPLGILLILLLLVESSFANRFYRALHG